MRHVTVERDDWTPWYERTKAELARLAQAEIHVGILGSAGGELLKIAAVHEFGATIHPRNAKNLAIPLSPRARARSPRDFDDLWTYDNGEDRFLVRDKGETGLEFLYLLLPSVTIPERSFIRAGYDGNKDLLATACENAVRRVVLGELTAEWSEDTPSSWQEIINQYKRVWV